MEQAGTGGEESGREKKGEEKGRGEKRKEREGRKKGGKSREVEVILEKRRRNRGGSHVMGVYWCGGRMTKTK